MFYTLLILFVRIPFIFAQQACYWPDGTQVTPQNNRYNFTACFEGDSQCCANGEVCLSNGLCFSGPQGQLYRGACTDRSWKTVSCPKYCDDSRLAVAYCSALQSMTFLRLSEWRAEYRALSNEFRRSMVVLVWLGFGEHVVSKGSECEFVQISVRNNREACIHGQHHQHDLPRSKWQRSTYEH